MAMEEGELTKALAVADSLQKQHTDWRAPRQLYKECLKRLLPPNVCNGHGRVLSESAQRANLARTSGRKARRTPTNNSPTAPSVSHARTHPPTPSVSHARTHPPSAHPTSIMCTQLLRTYYLRVWGLDST
jgi:hypothetical protein